MSTVIQLPSPEYEGLVLTEKGMINKKSFANAAHTFENDKNLVGVFKYNQLAKKTYITKNMPWENIKKSRVLTDNDEINATIWLERSLGIIATVSNIHSIILATAEKHQYNPVLDYLESLKWDGVARLENMLQDLLGVDDSVYTRAVGKRFMIGATARAYKPGCKMDNMLVLEGKQGKQQKSTFIERLFGSEFFGDAIMDIGGKDASMLVTQKWCFEIPELDALERKNSSESKAWLTRKIEEFRLPYGRNIVTVPRPSVFIGTTNEENYLKDATGGRRFWPVTCREYAHENLASSRDQLWAEAVKLYKSGERWWLVEEEVTEAEKEQESRQCVDIWESEIASFVDMKEYITVEEILGECLLIPKDKWNRSIQMRVSSVLTHLGMERKQVVKNSKRKWIYMKKTLQGFLDYNSVEV